MNKAFMFIVLFLAMAGLVYGFDTDKIYAYYSFNNVANSVIISDVVNDNDMTRIDNVSASNYSVVAGLFTLDQAFNFSNPSCPYTNYCYDKIYIDTTLNGTQPFCVNSWIKLRDTYAGYPFFIGNNVSWRHRPVLTTTSIRVYNNSNNVNTSTSPTALDEWTMITYCNNGTKFTTYLNADETSVSFSYGLPVMLSLEIGNGNHIIDEIMIYNGTLTTSDLAYLYNLGDGVQFNDFVDNTSILFSFIDVCLTDTTLCHQYNVYENSGNCAVAQQQYCSPLVCVDNSSYYDNLGIYPPNYNYSGSCGLCNNNCYTENSTSCNGNDVYTCEIMSNGCFRKVYTKTCFGLYSCVQGECEYLGWLGDENETVYNDTSLPLGTKTSSNVELWDGFANIDATNNTGQLLIAIICIMLAALVGVGVSLAIRKASGQSLPNGFAIIVVLGLMLLTTFYFISIGFIPFWILIILILIVGLGIANKLSGAIFGRGE